jgi:hypothetical protein
VSAVARCRREPPGSGVAVAGEEAAQPLHAAVYVTEGEGRAQSRGEPLHTIRPGDVVHTPSGEWHWHGAAPDHFMTHLSLTEWPPTWGDHVSDDEYQDGQDGQDVR